MSRRSPDQPCRPRRYRATTERVPSVSHCVERRPSPLLCCGTCLNSSLSCRTTGAVSLSSSPVRPASPVAVPFRRAAGQSTLPGVRATSR
jgi:hypothetical protein